MDLKIVGWTDYDSAYPSIALTNRNAILMVEIIKKVRVVRIFVQIKGSVTWKNWVTRPAPSNPELSYSDAGTADMDAIYMTI